MVAGHTNQVADVHENFVMRTRMVGQHRFSIVGVLAAVVVNIVQRFKPMRCIRMHGLHNFVGDTAHLRTECAHQEVGHCKQMNVNDDSV